MGCMTSKSLSREVDVFRGGTSLLFEEKDEEGARSRSGTLPSPRGDKSSNLAVGLEAVEGPVEEFYKDILKLMCAVFKVPVALINLACKEEFWFQDPEGRRFNGFVGGTTDCEGVIFESPLLSSFPEPVVAPNIRMDLQFRQSTLLQQFPGISSYAGIPLVASGGPKFGTLCVIDYVVREDFDAEKCNVMAHLGDMVSRELERRWEGQVPAGLEVVANAGTEAIMKQSAALVEACTQHQARSGERQGLLLLNCLGMWPIYYVNNMWSHFTGIRLSKQHTNFWDLFQLYDGGEDDTCRSEDQGRNSSSSTSRSQELDYRAAVENNKDFQLQVVYMKGGKRLICTISFWSAGNTGIQGRPPRMCVPPVVTLCSQDTQFYFATIDDYSTQLDDTANEGEGGHLPVMAAEPKPWSEHTVVAPRVPGGGTRRQSRLIKLQLTPFADVQLGILLGRGSFGRVYRGIWRDQLVAVKVLDQVDRGRVSFVCTSSPSPVAQPLEASEVTVMHSLDHPNVVKIHLSMTREVVQDVDVTLHNEVESRGDMRNTLWETWIVLEFCDRGTLSDGVARGWFLNDEDQPHIGRIMSVAGEVASAMEYLHSKNILHGDLTGNNILLSSCHLGGLEMLCGCHAEELSFTAKVSDFGLSRVLPLDCSHVSTITHGTAAYMPPEVLRDGILSKAMDVYAYGVLLYEMFVGKRPYADLHHGQLICKISSGMVPEVPEGAPEPLRQLIIDCLNPNPKARPTFTEILTRLPEVSMGFF